mgnify:CR=1 FL=1
MGATNYTTNSDMLTLLALRVKEYRLAARMSQKEQRLAEILPELPMPPMALREIEKLIPKRVRRGKK